MTDQIIPHLDAAAQALPDRINQLYQDLRIPLVRDPNISDHVDTAIAALLCHVANLERRVAALEQSHFYLATTPSSAQERIRRVIDAADRKSERDTPTRP